MLTLVQSQVVTAKKGIAYLHKYLESVFLALLSVSTPYILDSTPPRPPAAEAMPGQRFHNQPQVAMSAISPCFWGTRFRCVCVWCDAFHKFQGKKLFKKTGRFISSLYLAKSFSITEQFQSADPFKSQCGFVCHLDTMVSFQHICFSYWEQKECPAMLYCQPIQETGIAFDHRNRRVFSFRHWESDLEHFGTIHISTL